ncbi:MAG: hypothetical protein ACLQVM_06760 [Terriglobia bacterium]
MPTRKVIETVSGNIETDSGPDAHDTPGVQGWICWEGLAVH